MPGYLDTLLLDVIRPVHDGLHTEYGVPASIEADCLSLAIKVQESGLTAVRDQGDPNITGPATGLWQFELTGGIWEVLNMAKIAPIFRELCETSKVRPIDETVWRFFTTPQSDDLAAAAARLVMYLDPAPLPPATPAGVNAALDYYLRRWRPAKNEKRERDFVTKAWPAALAVIQANPRGDRPATTLPSSPEPAQPVQGVPAPPVAPASLEARVAALEAFLDRVRAVWR